MYPQWTYTQKIRLNHHKVHVTVLASVKCVLICTGSLGPGKKKIKMFTENACVSGMLESLEYIYKE